MNDLVVAEKYLSQRATYQLVSVVGNVAITQLVDKPNPRLPKSIFHPAEATNGIAGRPR